MGFVLLAVFPLKYGFIIVQNTIAHFTSSDYQQATGEMHATFPILIIGGVSVKENPQLGLS